MIKIFNNCFHLFTDCITVKGYKQTAIIDYNEKSYFFIPNELNNVLSHLNKSDIKTVKEKFNNEFDSEIDSFCNNLIFQNKGFYSQTKLNFPLLNKTWTIPYHITNIILSVNNSLNYNALINFKIDCLGINIYEYNSKTIHELNLIIEKVKHNTLQFFIYCDIEQSIISFFINSYNKLSHLYLLFTTKKNIEEADGVIIIHRQAKTYVDENNFIINLPLFTESQKHNTYFNRKLYIGANGEIKNATETKTIFGNINEFENSEDILKIIDSSEFQKYWYVHKGLIDVCKQCEFRHMCVDNREPIKRTEKEWYFEKECNYNPYIAKWQNEEGYKTLSECGIQSNADGFKINRKKLNGINKEIWGV